MRMLCVLGSLGASVLPACGARSVEGADVTIHGLDAHDVATTPADQGPRDVPVVQDVSDTPVSPCVPEVCDGLDNQCDGVVDDGCPRAGEYAATFSIASEADTGPMLSGQGGWAARDLRCPAGEVLVGIMLSYPPLGGWSRRFFGVCAALLIRARTQQTPFVYTLGWEPNTNHHVEAGTWSERGGDERSALCPNDTVMAGYQSQTGGEMDGFQIRCRRVIVSSRAPDTIAFEGPPQVVDPPIGYFDALGGAVRVCPDAFPVLVGGTAMGNGYPRGFIGRCARPEGVVPRR